MITKINRQVNEAGKNSWLEVLSVFGKKRMI